MTAFGRIGIRRPEITAQHMADAENEANLVQVKYSNIQPNLWTDEFYQISLLEGVDTYTLPARMIAIMASYITTAFGGTSNDRIIWQISTFEWAALPDKTSQGQPTSMWYNRIVPPEIKLWPVPDATGQYTLNLRICRQIQDVVIPGGVTLDLPYRWLDAFIAEMAYRLSRIYAPDKEQMRKQDATEALDNALVEDQERVPIMIGGPMAQYWR